jgi:hypothetical protein
LHRQADEDQHRNRQDDVDSDGNPGHPSRSAETLSEPEERLTLLLTGRIGVDRHRDLDAAVPGTMVISPG